MLYIFLLTFTTQVQQIDGICYKLLLDSQIKRALCSKAGCMIDFYQPWLQIRIQHNIKAQDLEA